jgi:long-chain acyl-CoA synthetase
MIPEFEETNMTATSYNCARRMWDRVRLVSQYKDGRHTGEWQEITTAEMAEEDLRLATAWRMLGVERQDRVAIMSPNRPRWVHTIQSLLMVDAVTVTVYPTLSAEEAQYLLEDSGAKYLVVDTLARAHELLPVVEAVPALRKVVVMEPVAENDEEKILAYDDLVAMGAGNVDQEALFEIARTITPDHLAALIYTSGTTGHPKGVMLTHGNFMSQRIVLESFDLSEDDIFLNHLPFCHAFGLTSDLFGSAAAGATLVIADGMAPEQIRHALQTIRPTVLMSVPRLYEKVYVQVQQVVAERPPAVQRLFNGALAVGKEVFDRQTSGEAIPAGMRIKHRFARRIAKKVLARAGLDRVRIAYAGGAPTSRELCHFYQGLGINLYQGYGLTETSPIATVNLPGKNKLGTVGPPMPGVEVAIAEDGEVLIRGGNIMKGYYNKPEATAEAIDEEGWFHSGDIGELDEDGYLKIVDRKKELIITSGGKNVAPLVIESAFNTEMYIERVALIGDQRNFISALICPNFEALHGWAKNAGLSWKDDTELVSLPEVQALMEERVAAVNQHFARFEQIRKFIVLDHVFSVESGELTPTEKLKRRVIMERYADRIEGLYA